MQIITFKCDKCGKSWISTDKEKPQEVNLCLRLNYGYNYPEDAAYSGTTMAHQTWCRPCVEKHVKTPNKKDSSPAQVQRQETELLVELLERLGFNRQQ